MSASGVETMDFTATGWAGIVPFSGDVNDDGKVNGTDVTLLATYVKARGNGVVIH